MPRNALLDECCRCRVGNGVVTTPFLNWTTRSQEHFACGVRYRERRSGFAGSVAESYELTTVIHHARVERNAFTLVISGSSTSRWYSGESIATSAIWPLALLWIPHP